MINLVYDLTVFSVGNKCCIPEVLLVSLVLYGKNAIYHRGELHVFRQGKTGFIYCPPICSPSGDVIISSNWKGKLKTGKMA